MKNMMLLTALVMISLPGMAATKKSMPLSFKEHVTVKSVKVKPLKSSNLAALFNGVTVTENNRKPAIEETKSI